MTDDWPDWLTADSLTATTAIRDRFAIVNAEMDEWEARFFDTLDRRCDCHVGSGEGAWREIHDPECSTERWKDS